MALKTLPFDAADTLDTADERAAFLTEAFASGDPAIVTAALGMIARARGISQISRETGLSREVAYKATGPEGNPTLTTLMGIGAGDGIAALGGGGAGVTLETRPRLVIPKLDETNLFPSILSLSKDCPFFL